MTDRPMLTEAEAPTGADLASVASTFEALTKKQLLNVLERVPQHFWPPRPTRQDKSTLQWVVVRAVRSGRYVFDIEHARDLTATEVPPAKSDGWGRGMFIAGAAAGVTPYRRKP